MRLTSNFLALPSLLATRRALCHRAHAASYTPRAAPSRATGTSRKAAPLKERERQDSMPSARIVIASSSMAARPPDSTAARSSSKVAWGRPCPQSPSRSR